MAINGSAQAIGLNQWLDLFDCYRSKPFLSPCYKSDWEDESIEIFHAWQG